ncbi:MAG: SIS domain-containing protein [Planctomycetales bacterium]|nr:SIS domain-containing protein [Planctomycetales bacterium]
MRRFDPATRILDEVSRVLGGVSRPATERFVDRLLAADQIFVAARGRTGLVAGAFAMRLMHLGLRVWIVGEITTPKIGPRDLLIACSGSGAAHTVSQMVSIARRERAAIVFITYNPAPATARPATIFIRIPTTNLRARGTARRTIQPLGSLFEQALFVYLDSVVLRLMERLRISADDMAARHTNLE